MRNLLAAGIRRVFLIAVLIICPAAIASVDAAKSYFAERFDSHVRVMPGGALEVTETVAFRFESGTFDHVFREIPTRRTDGIDIVSASMDGRPFPIGDGVNQIQVTGSSKVRVQWRFHPIADSTHVFVLSYVARGVAWQANDADVLAWRALPTDHAYRILSSTVDFEFPATLGASPSGLAAPKIERHRIDGLANTTVRRGAEDSSAAPVIAQAVASGIRTNGWLEARFDLPRGSLVSTVPSWQQAQLAAQALAPRWATAGLLIALAGLIVLFGLRQQYDSPRREQPGVRSSPAAPDSLPPALVGTLLSNGRTVHEHAIAALLSLADRGVVSIEERPKGFLGHAAFGIRSLRTKLPLAAHERALMSITLDETKIGEATSLATARRRLVRRFRQFSAAVREDLVAAGLLDADRKRIRDRYVRIAICVLVLSGLGVMLAGLLLVGRYGGWPMLIPAAFAVIGVSAMIFAAATTPLSDEGLRRAAGWRGFREHLKAIAQERQPAATDVHALLPFAVAAGLAAGWAKYVKRHPGNVPPWFRALSAASQERAFVALMTSAEGHGSAGTGAGGAAGGGASGAG
jgi:hypothetical protein